MNNHKSQMKKDQKDIVVKYLKTMVAEMPNCEEKFYIDLAIGYLEERSHGKWEYLKEHITEMRDADGELNQKDTCQFILNLMGVIEKEGEVE